MAKTTTGKKIIDVDGWEGDYEGDFVNGKEHGNGIEYNCIRQITQKGKWCNVPVIKVSI
ncbi:MAG: hypothetical protein FWB86_14515 [Treponema sp.]|nr:hypothetical protein [Treponema sp.]